MRMQLMVEALAQAIEKARGTDAVRVANALERRDGDTCRASPARCAQPTTSSSSSWSWV